VIRIELPLVPLRGPKTVNVYLLPGPPLTLVDTSPRTERAWAALEAGLADHGCQIADLKQIILTHAHADHYGQAVRLAAVSGADLLAHGDAIPWLSDAAGLADRNWRHFKETVIRAGVPADLLERWFAVQHRDGPLAEPVQVTRPVGAGECLVIGEATWEVVHLPGHAPGLIGLLCRQTGEILVSDHLLPDMAAAPGLYVAADGAAERPRYTGDYLAALRMLAALPVRTAWPGHGEPISDVPELVERRLAGHQRQADELAELLADGEKTPYDLWRALFPRLLPLDPPNGVAQVISHLDLLEAQGRVAAREREGLIYYRRV
jgi:glyoxylase-like metal-dependent hydrolase (beta-lactamase superfamily II)